MSGLSSFDTLSTDTFVQEPNYLVAFHKKVEQEQERVTCRALMIHRRLFNGYMVLNVNNLQWLLLRKLEIFLLFFHSLSFRALMAYGVGFFCVSVIYCTYANTHIAQTLTWSTHRIHTIDVEICECGVCYVT